MLLILDEVLGSMCSGPASSDMTGTLTMEDTGDDIGEEGIGAIKTCIDSARPQSVLWMTLLNQTIILYFNYLLQEM